MNCRLGLLLKLSSVIKPINPRVFSTSSFSNQMRRPSSVERNFQEYDRNRSNSAIDSFVRKPRLSEQQLYLNEHLTVNIKAYDHKQWDRILSKILSIPTSHAAFAINPVNLTGKVVNSCAEVKNFQLALNFMEYLESKGEEINLGTLSSFLRFCIDIPECTEETIIKYYEVLKKRSTIMSPATAETILTALCLTRKWKEAIPLLDNIKSANESVRGLIFSNLAKAAFKNQEVEMGWGWFYEALAYSKSVNTDAYAAWFQYSAKNEPTVENGERLLSYLHENNIPIGLFTADDIKQYFQSVVKPPWTVNSTLVKNK